ncbi:iron chelate uptake ABC transporter family permease subunit [Phytoactinopolyspora alkaliphila]|uniref:Iron chelate uptake ABC transporter family permease subunit n=1 Tax=Phytoactinopolyspora alkaliphila TaxID=1783498 RepID=A0A6N9YKT6_9ACTN|nr:iron chelate uptake ABC transporter family permease subunit [Phytoactinopolyspora alkaliphila]NED95537.1 iron chelate uptake ABC transporter family permease subunit [Phytoactinopolyspora alkaliphila]
MTVGSPDAVLDPAAKPVGTSSIGSVASDAPAGRHVVRTVGIIVAAVALLVGSVLVAVTIGQADISVREVWTVVSDRLGLSFLQVDVIGLGGQPPSPIRADVIWEMRFPRALGAVVVGAGLAVVGAIMQTLTRNPMADPYLLGISSGASLGAVLVIVAGLGSGLFGVSAGAFAGALIAFVLVLTIGQRSGTLTPVRMILAGVAIGQLCGAVTSFVILWVADPHATQDAQFWLSGSLAASRWSSMRIAAVVLVVALLLWLWNARALNAFTFGDDAAASLGVDVNRIRWTLLIACALLTGVLVAVSGAIGFVGLLLPHAVRFLVGPDHRLVLPLSTVLGGVFLLWVDTVARTAFEPRELPVGVVTAIIGVPAFIWILRKRQVRA